MESVPYSIATWERSVGKDQQDQRGSHRAVVHVAEEADAVHAHLPWRRRDIAPEAKAVIVVDAATSNKIDNVFTLEITNEYGDIAFQPLTVPGDYHIYYLPHSKPRHPMDSASYKYLAPGDTADPEWEKRNGLDGAPSSSLPRARLLRFEARSEWDRFDPMEIPATAKETENFLTAHPDRDYLVFPEDRRFPIRMFEAIPVRWINQDPGNAFTGQAQPGEYYTFQLGIYAARSSVENLKISTALQPKTENRKPKTALTCFNLEGTDWLGRPMEKRFDVPRGRVRALWFGVQIPDDASDSFQGTVTLQPEGGVETTVKIRIDVSGPLLSDHGDSELWRHSRLRWLNSTMGLEDTLVPPFTPLEVSGDRVGCLGREILFGENGLPRSIRSFFRHGELPEKPGEGRELLAGPIRFLVEIGDELVDWQEASDRIVKANDAVLIRESACRAGPLTKRTRLEMEFDGSLHYEISLSAAEPTPIGDIRLEVPFRREIAGYMLGFSRSGGRRPAEWDWEWKEDWSDNMVWLGDPGTGLQCKLITEPGVWQKENLMATGLPETWWNGGKGGAKIRENGDAVLVTAFSGQRLLEPGEPLVFRFRFLVTPFKPIDKRHWGWRIGDALRGSTIKHAHHGISVNPFINYPFVYPDALAAGVRFEREEGSEKVMIYYTVRELSNRAAELWALRSLGDEIFFVGDVRGSASTYEVMGDYGAEAGSEDYYGGYPWLQEHLVAGYSWRWMMPTDAPGEPVDAAIATQPLSRWHNYYIEGLAWLIEHTDIDGIYLDGIGYDREIIKRVRRVLHELKPEDAYINFHSGNSAHDATTHRVTPMSGYMEHLPYISHLHFGEHYDNSESSDYYLIEMSGIPFGLVNEYRGTPHKENPYRGMIYAGAGRQDESRYSLWPFWDDFGIQETEMIGYWEPDCPVRTGREDILATVYRKPGRALIALASWAPDDAEVTLEMDWKSLGLDAGSATLTAPAIEHFQKAATFAPTEAIPVAANKGWLLVVE